MAPGAWEMVQARRRSILLATLCPPDLGITLSFNRRLKDLQLPPGSNFTWVIGQPWGPGRNQAIRMALDGGYGYLGFLDADVRLPPDAYLRLMESGLDVASGLYYQRYHPYLPVLFNEGQDPQGKPTKLPLVGWRPGDIVPCTFVPGGALLVKRGVLEGVLRHFPRPFEWGLDIAPIPDGFGGNLPQYSEDFQFSKRCQVCGFTVGVHTGVVGLHEVWAVVGPKGIVPQPDPQPVWGVCSVLAQEG